MTSLAGRPDSTSQAPLVGVLMLETTFPRIRGDIGNPDSFSFPVMYKTVSGATPKNVVIDADPALIDRFAAAGRDLTARGVKAICTSCGFLALFHRQLVKALDVPIFTSSLLEAHLARAVIRPDRKIGIITARRKSLTRAHLAGVGIETYPLAIVGMDDADEFSAVFIHGKSTLDEDACRNEMRRAAQTLMRRYPDTGAVILECTNMPPYADTVREVTGLPVFDAVTLVNHAHGVVAPQLS